MGECAMQVIEKHLLVCALGPVQDFIATARTSRDLWFGSWMLSELSKAAAKCLAAEPNQLVFPAPRSVGDLDPGSDLSVANKIAAVVEGDPQVITDQMRQAVTERLMAFWSEVRRAVTGAVDWDLAQEQLGDLVEFTWASVPYPGAPHYRRARSQAEACLASRKNTRGFRQTQGRAGTPKSSLDGARESVLVGHSGSMTSDQRFVAYHAEPGEELSGIDLLKRRAKDQKFPSTTDIAAKPYRIMLGTGKDSCLLERIDLLLRDYTCSQETAGAHYYPERLAQLIPDVDRRRKFRQEYARIFKTEGIERQASPHYALLLADGDDMGRTIDALQTSEQHRSFSQRLSEFAAIANERIGSHSGAPIYVGGDDILAYLPLHTALACVSELDAEFRATLRDFAYQRDGAMRSPTLSGALVIAHHLTPLSDVLETARGAEKKAKAVKGKNALTIVLSKRGGADRTAVAPLGELLDRMRVLIGYRRQRLISAGTAYELEQLHRQLGGSELQAKALSKEAERIIKRKYEGGGHQAIRPEVLEQFRAWFGHPEPHLAELAQEMIIAAEFAGAYEMADIDIGEVQG